MSAYRRFAGAVLLSAALAAPAAARPASAAPASLPSGRESAIEKSPEGFDTPNVSRSRFLGWVRRDLTERVPGEETLFKQYEDEWGFQFEALSINGVVFAYNLDVDGRYPYDITLLDTDCDGVFETKVEEKPGQRVDMSIPECVFAVRTTQNR